MNCQEFRKKWVHEAGHDALSHIEECDDCLNWIEANFTSDEEVRFMKEYPQPSAQLEDRIMQAIYTISLSGSQPPVSAAGQPIQRDQPTSARRIGWRWQSLAWAGAACFLLAAGLFSLKGLGPGETDMAAKVASGSQEAAGGQMSPQAAINQTAEMETAKTESNPAGSSPTDSVAAADPSVGQKQADAIQPAPSALSAPENAVAKTAPAAKEGTPAHHEAADKKNDQGTDASGMIAARGKEKSQPSAPAAPAGSAVQQPEQTGALANAAVTENQAAVTAPVTLFGIAADPQAKDGGSAAASTAQKQAGEQTGTAAAAVPVAPPVPPKQPITMSTFTEMETAVQASDLPVPSSAKLPNGFAFSSVSLQYESETSKRVTSVTTVYSRNADVIKIEVTPNLYGKRSLSIPGTFTETRVFTIDNEQAIGVTYDPQAKHETESVPQHAVYFNTMKENHSLYVVISGNGVRLEELTELAKQLSWS
jgi:hypothetical protein